MPRGAVRCLNGHFAWLCPVCATAVCRACHMDECPKCAEEESP